MDPLSVTASVLTVVGAAGAVLKSLKKLSSFRRAPEEVHALIDEVSDLQTVLRDIETFLQERRENDRSLHRVLGLSVLLERAKDKLLELDSIIHYRLINHQHSDSGFEVARTKWVGEKTAVASIQQALRDIRLNLTTALSTTAVFDASELIFRLQGIRLHIEELRNGQHRLEDQNRGIISDLQLGQKKNYQAKPENTQVIDAPAKSPYLNFPVDILVGGPDDKEAERLRFSSSLRQAPGHRPWCQCRCHRQRNLRSPILLSRLIGSLSVQVGGALKCSPQTFEGRKCQQFCQHWRLPTVQVKLEGPRFSLTLPRVVSSYSSIFRYAFIGDINGIRELFREGLASPYDVALLFFRPEVCKMLINAKADRALESKNGDSPIDLAWNLILMGRQDAKDALGSWFSDDDYLDRQAFTILHRIVFGLWPEVPQCREVRASVAEYLRQALEVSSECINVVDANGKTPLFWACCSYKQRSMHFVKSFKSLKALLSFGAEVDARNAFNETALHTSVTTQGDARFLMLLLTAGADINARTTQGVTALCYAVRTNRTEIVRCLLQHGADPKTFDCKGYTPLSTSIYHNSHKSLRLLLVSGADHTFWTSELGTILHMAAQTGDVQTLRILTEARLTGINIEASDRYGRTALDWLYRRHYLTGELEIAFKALLDSVREGNQRITSAENDDSNDSVEADPGTDHFTDASENPTVNDRGD
ncbi:MAG: hypothetical protein M1830_000415 [Pleopsidium flavum]|nr:MAG: hypothetical protein M1830_000415 [Pleopsidium flavum]